jgi:acyl-CoA synthetase (AMP-forming)/AMP-acid ligase II
LGSWRAVINCSEPVYDESHQAFVEKLAPYGFSPNALAVSYAMAENTFAVTQTPIGTPPKVDVVEIAALQERGEAVPAAGGKKVVSCGPAIESVELAIFDAERRPLPERRVGEIALRSEFMLSGYYKRPDLSSQALTADGWCVTGDMGYLADGELYITGRKKDLIIVGGKNIYPQDLEDIANRTTGVYPGRAVVFGVLDERLGSEKVVIICETSDGADLAAAEQELRPALRTARLDSQNVQWQARPDRQPREIPAGIWQLGSNCHSERSQESFRALQTHLVWSALKDSSSLRSSE